MVKEAVILAGGLGTRLQTVVKDIPKPMADINGSPFLKYLLDFCIQHNVEHVVLSVGYKFEVIQDYFGDIYKGLKLSYAVEKDRLGTGGGIKFASEKIKDDDFFALNGDTFFNVPLQEFAEASRNSPVILAAKSMKNFDRYGTLVVNDHSFVTKFEEKKSCDSGLINGGIYRLKKSHLGQVKQNAFSLETEYLEKLAGKNQIKAVVYEGYFKDIGIPEDYYQFIEDIKS